MSDGNIDILHKVDDSFTNMLIFLVELASNAHQAFTGSTIAEKHNLVNLTFSNLSLNAEKLDFMLRPPFDTFVKIPNNREWWVIVDSNHRPLRCQRNALTN